MKKSIKVRRGRAARGLAPAGEPRRDPVLELFQPLLEPRSHNLFTTMEMVEAGGLRYLFPKFLLLGERGGGTPMKVGIFAGIDGRRRETVAAVARLLMQFDLVPALARDYALIAFPVTNLPGIYDQEAGEEPLHERWRRRPDEGDAHYFRAELAHLGLHGIIRFRATAGVTAFTAATRSSLFADEILEPVLQSLSALGPVAPVLRWKDNRAAREVDFAAGGLVPHPALRPWPFEVEFTVPTAFSADLAVSALSLATVQVLRGYRVFVSQQAGL